MWSSSHLFQQDRETSAWSCLPGACIDASDPRISTTLSKTGSSSSLPQQQRDETEELFISEFNQLSIEDQVKALDDIYSAGSELKEEPAMINWLLTEFEQVVEQGNYPIYTIALNQDSSYVEDPSFRLTFLRANSHNVHKAVGQMIRFLNHKAKVFGVDKVAQDITIEDLTTSDLKLLLSGVYHIQDGTDRHGRPIIFVLGWGAQRQNIDSEIRVLYYFWFNILIPLYSVQMKGAVMVVYDALKPDNGQHNTTTTSPTLPDLARFVDFLNCIPVRLSAFHLCTKREVNIANQLRDASLHLCLKGMPKSARERARVHSGSPVELQYLLSTYGIPQDTFPVDLVGNRRQGLQNAWFYKHLESEGGIGQHFGACNDSDDSFSGEEDESSENPVLRRRVGMESNYGQEGMPANALDDQGEVNNHLPYTNRDVLLGRGYAVQNHPGNTAFREFLRGHQAEYDSAPRHSKGQIYKSLTRALMATGVRFWQKSPDEDDTWVEASFEEACKKASQLFRSMRKTLVNNNNR